MALSIISLVLVFGPIFDGPIIFIEAARGVEFVILTTWQSMEAIRQFAGEPADVAVGPPVAQAMMVEYNKKVADYEIAYTYQRE